MSKDNEAMTILALALFFIVVGGLFASANLSGDFGAIFQQWGSYIESLGYTLLLAIILTIIILALVALASMLGLINL